MKLIVGLGNPGRRYEGTRHNVGWWMLDHLADVWRFGGWRTEGDALVVDGHLGDVRVRLIKPQTYMNLSGAALRPYLPRLGWSGLQDLLVIVDDVAIPLGTFRLRAAGSAGGHNGLKSIEATLGTRDYARLRIGILPTGEPGITGPLADFVLDPFQDEERRHLALLLPDLEGVIDVWAREGIQRAMNRSPATRPPSP